MTVVLIAAGLTALIAGLGGTLVARYGGRAAPAALVVLVSVAAPLLLLSLFTGEAGDVTDVLGIALLLAGLLGLIVLLSLPLLSRRNTSTASVVVGSIAAALTLAFSIWLIVATGDGLSTVIILGFVFLLLGAVAAVIGLVWMAVQLIRRKARPALAFVWSAVSLAIIGFVGVAVLSPSPAPVPEAFTGIAELDRYLEDLTDSGGPPAISLVVVKDGAMVYNKAFGMADGPNGIPATPDSVYHWFSVTKIPTAIAALQLVEQGVISLDDEVSEYLPFFDVEYPSADSQPITIAHLLTHSSGLPDDIPACMGCVHLEGAPALNQTDLLRDEKLPRYNTLKFEPGSEAVYTNVGYHTLGVVVEQASGLSYEEYVKRNILDPLGMDNTRFEYTSEMKSNAAVGAHPMADLQSIFFPLIEAPWPSEYVRDYEDGWAWFNRFLFDANPLSGLIGPTPELARLVTALLNGGELDGARILSEETVEMMLTKRHVTPGSSPQWGDFKRFEDWEQGLGFKVVNDGGRVHYAHGGGGAAFRAFMRLYPEEQLGIVILVNSTNLDRQEIADAVADMEW
jgi:CubicO group peptidase (beta-lactamase class C family)